jgi:ankyrin repeat protein
MANHNSIDDFNLRIIEIMIEDGLEINRVDEYGQTLLDLAIRDNNKPLIKLLKKHGGEEGMQIECEID